MLTITHRVYHMGIHPTDDDHGDVIQDAQTEFGLTIVANVESIAGVCTDVQGSYVDVCRFVTWLYDVDSAVGDDEAMDCVIDALPHTLDDELAFVE